MDSWTEQKVQEIQERRAELIGSIRPTLDNIALTERMLDAMGVEVEAFGATAAGELVVEPTPAPEPADVSSTVAEIGRKATPAILGTEEPPESADDLRERVLAFIEGNGPVSSRQVRTGVRGKTERIEQVIAELKARGVIARGDHGWVRYAPAAAAEPTPPPVGEPGDLVAQNRVLAYVQEKPRSSRDIHRWYKEEHGEDLGDALRQMKRAGLIHDTGERDAAKFPLLAAGPPPSKVGAEPTARVAGPKRKASGGPTPEPVPARLRTMPATWGMTEARPAQIGAAEKQLATYNYVRRHDNVIGPEVIRALERGELGIKVGPGEISRHLRELERVGLLRKLPGLRFDEEQLKRKATGGVGGRPAIQYEALDKIEAAEPEPEPEPSAQEPELEGISLGDQRKSAILNHIRSLGGKAPQSGFKALLGVASSGSVIPHIRELETEGKIRQTGKKIESAAGPPSIEWEIVEEQDETVDEVTREPEPEPEPEISPALGAVRDTAVREFGEETFSPGQLITRVEGWSFDETLEQLRELARLGILIDESPAPDVSMFRWERPKAPGRAAEIDQQRRRASGDGDGSVSDPVAGTGKLWQPGNPDLRKLVGEIRQLGGTAQPAGGGHVEVRYGGQKRLIPSTPGGSPKNLLRVRQNLRRIGLMV